jgi:hypothetical protein
MFLYRLMHRFNHAYGNVFYQHTCQTAIYYHHEKFCSTFIELCKTGTIQPAELVWTSVICSRKDPGKIIFFIKISKRISFLEPISTCSSTSTDHQRQQEETSNWDMITNTAAGKYDDVCIYDQNMAIHRS